MLTVLTAGVKEKKGADFLRINDNIQNKELRAELEGLRDEFKFERNRIHDYYKEKIEEMNPDAMLADGLDDALAGYDSRGRAVYHIEEILGILIVRDGMTEEEAQEFFDFNIDGAHMGQFTPIYMWEE